MLGYLAYYDYTWFEFKSSQLPVETVVIEQERSSHFFRPWSYVLPAVSSFAVIDNKVRKSQQQGETLVEYIRYEFINDYTERLETQPYVLNCATAQQLAIPQSDSTSSIQVESIARDSLLYKQLCH